jgi:hypothetical protein
MRSVLTALALTAGLTLCLRGTAAAQDWGTVKGQVTWGGKALPVPEKLNVNKDEAHCLSKGPIHSEEFVVNKTNKGVRYAFVWLIDPSNPTAALPTHPTLKAIKDKEVVMDQPCCMFAPRAIGLRDGQVLIGKNSAPIAHNMKWQGGDDNPGDNKIIPPGGQIKIADLVPSHRPVVVECNIHPWMKAWVRVFSHPYFAVTDADGKFEIKNAPAGKYNVVIWHEGVGWVNGGKLGQEITIPANGTVEVKGEVKPEEK